MDRLNLDPSDITLVVKDGKQFKAHRNVLSQASPFFEKLLSSDMKESNEGVIRLQTITESQMADILQFIYNGSVQITSQENAEKLIETANFLLLSNLKTMAGKFLEQHMTTKTSISMNYLAERYSCEELVASTHKFINLNFTTVTTSEEFLSLPSHEVEKWISSDEIVIDAEENVFESVLRWIDHDKSERSGKFSKMLSHVRLTCVSRDYLVRHVVTNDLVKEDAHCLGKVNEALEWLDRPTDCDVPRPHPPRKALTMNVIVIVDCYGEMKPCIYHPAANKWFLLPEIERRRLKTIEHIVSCRGKVFFITDYVNRSQCYDPDLNRWSSAPWTDNLPFYTGKPLVVNNRICFLVQKTPSLTDLWTYSLEDSNSLTLLHTNSVERVAFCAVAVDNYLYVIGGSLWNCDGSLSECGRFDTEENKWQKIAPLNERRQRPFGVCKNEKIFVAGGSSSIESGSVLLKTCEVYNILTDEWQFIASLAVGRGFGSTMLVDETLCVLGGRTDVAGYMGARELSDRVECYNHESNEWNDQATVPVDKIKIKKRGHPWNFLKGCTLPVFKGVLTNLKSLAESHT